MKADVSTCQLASLAAKTPESGASSTRFAQRADRLASAKMDKQVPKRSYLWMPNDSKHFFASSKHVVGAVNGTASGYGFLNVACPHGDVRTGAIVNAPGLIALWPTPGS